ARRDLGLADLHLDLGALTGTHFVANAAKGQVRAERAPFRFEANDSECGVDRADEGFEPQDVASDAHPHDAKAFAAARGADVRELELEGGVPDDGFLDGELDGRELLYRYLTEELEGDVDAFGANPSHHIAATAADVVDEAAD